MYRYDITTPCKDSIYKVRLKANKKSVLAKLVVCACYVCNNTQCRWSGGMEQWDVSKTCDQLGTKYLQILSMCNVTGSASTSYLFVKGKVSALNILMVGDIPELNLALGL